MESQPREHPRKVPATEIAAHATESKETEDAAKPVEMDADHGRETESPSTVQNDPAE